MKNRTMSKIYMSVLLMSALFFVSGCQLQPSQMKVDLDFLFKTIEDVHPNMYAYISEDKFGQHRKRLYGQINQPLTRAEFYKLAAPVIAELRCGHLRLWPPNGDFGAMSRNVFAIGLRWDGQNAILKENYGPKKLPLGGKLLEINGQDANSIIYKFARYQADECKNADPWIIERADFLRFYTWLEFGDARALKLKIKARDGKEDYYTVTTIPARKLAGQVKDNEKKWSYRQLPEYNAGLMEINQWDNTTEFNEFLNGTFKIIADDKTSNLIIDLRNNPGGYSPPVQWILEYLTDKPFRTSEKMETKVSQQVLQATGRTLEEFRRMLGDESIEFGHVIIQNIHLRKPVDRRYRFGGNIFVVIGRQTASASVEFASAIKCFNIGILVGEETGDTTVSFGNVFSFKLNNSRLRFGVPSKLIFQACGKSDGRGVIPDHEVSQSSEDTVKGIDTILQFTLSLIKSDTVKK